MTYVLCTNTGAINKVDKIGSGEVIFSDIIQVILCELDKYHTPFSLFYNYLRKSIYIDYETHRIILYDNYVTIITLRDDERLQCELKIAYTTLDLKIFAELNINGKTADTMARSVDSTRFRR